MLHDCLNLITLQIRDATFGNLGGTGWHWETPFQPWIALEAVWIWSGTSWI